jgi:hypothetical protein
MILMMILMHMMEITIMKRLEGHSHTEVELESITDIEYMRHLYLSLSIIFFNFILKIILNYILNTNK